MRCFTPGSNAIRSALATCCATSLWTAKTSAGQLPVVALGPEMRLRPGVDELGGDADLIAGAPHAALENRPGAKLATDLRGALLLSL